MVLYKYFKPKCEVQEIGSKPIDTKEHCIKENEKREGLISKYLVKEKAIAGK